MMNQQMDKNTIKRLPNESFETQEECIDCLHLLNIVH